MTTETQTDVRAWVGCLGCYNDGRLTGAWLDAEQASDLRSTSLADEGTYGNGSTFDRCRVCGGDEWWVMDHEGIPWLSGECSPSTFVEWAEAWAEVSDPDMVTAYIDGTNTPTTPNELGEAVTDAYDNYTGHSTVRDYAEEYADECLLADVPDEVTRYFDYDAFADDLEYGGDVFEYGGYVFRTN